MRVDLVVFDGVDDLDVVAPFEVLHMADRMGAGIAAGLVSVGGASQVSTQNGLRLGVTGVWSPGDADVVLVPGGGYGPRSSTGVRAEIASGVVPAALCAAQRPDLVFASVCTGALLLAAAGLLTDRACTTHHRAAADLVAAGGRYVHSRVVDDGDRVSAAGVTSGLDLALWLVERYAGATVAGQVESVLEYERRGEVWRTGAEPASTS